MRWNTRLNAFTLATCISLPLMASACKGGAKEQAKAEYKQNVVDMLDMVGAENDGYLIVRDLTPFWQATEYGNKLVDGPVAKVLDMVEATGEKVEREEFEEFRSHAGAAMAAIQAAEFDWSAGLVVHGEKGGEGIVMFKAKLDKLGAIAIAFEEDAKKVTDHCAQWKEDPTWVACGETADGAASHASGKQGAAILETLKAKLPGVDIEHANGVFQAEKVYATLTTDPGLHEIAAHIEEAEIEKLESFVGKGKANALRFVEPGDSFAWAQINMEGAKEEAGGVPAAAKQIVDAFNGEVFVGALSKPTSLVTMLGVTDAYPIRSGLDLAWTQKDQIPTTIPGVEGITLSFSEEELKLGDETFRVLEIKADGEKLAELGPTPLKPVVGAYVGGGYATAGFGLDAAAGEELAKHTGEGASKALLKTLPRNLASDLEAGEVGFVAHQSIDAFFSQGFQDFLRKSWGELELPDKPAFDTVLPVFQLFAHWSETSMWLSHADTTPVFHYAIRNFGDMKTEEGKAAYAAIEAVSGGATPAQAYGELAKKYGSSFRAHSYGARAATTAEGANLGSIAAIGVLAAVAIPAFSKYQRRSQEASMQAMEAQMEMERAMKEAEAAAAAAGAQPATP
jgi:hypothetical protein